MLSPDAILDDTALRTLLGVTPATLARARREGKLRFTRQGNRILYLGEWVVEWLRRDAAQLAPSEELPR
jgi:hypothetical protein